MNWVLDADIRGFFDNIDRGWLLEFLEHRIADRRICGSSSNSWRRESSRTASGRRPKLARRRARGLTALANVYLHYVFDLWVQWWRKVRDGDVIVVRYADDFICGFRAPSGGAAVLGELGERFAKFGLALHPDKTRLIEFGRHAA